MNTENNQHKAMPLALAQAAKIRTAICLLESGFEEDIDLDDLSISASTLESLHARVQELEGHIAQAREMVAPVVWPEPDSYLFQHEDTGQTMFVDAQQVEWGFEANNPRLHKVSGVYTEQQVRELLATGGQAAATTEGATNEVTVLPDGSAFAVYSYPLPKGHWLSAPREYEQGAEEPKELAAPILTHAAREQVVSAIRYAVRAATDCGKETDFDPDALVQNAVYALCGPFNKNQPQPQADVQAVEKSATHGMNLHQRILHVGGRENAQTYIEFGSVAAVRALVAQVLRDWSDGAHGFAMPAPQPQADALDAIAAAAAAEREACAKVCETFADRVFDTGFTPVEKEHPFSTIAGANQCAADIRNRAAIAEAKENK